MKEVRYLVQHNARLAAMADSEYEILSGIASFKKRRIERIKLVFKEYNYKEANVVKNSK